MEAFIVPNVPQQAVPAQRLPKFEQKNDDSSFGPALTQAISKHKNSQEAAGNKSNTAPEDENTLNTSLHTNVEDGEQTALLMDEGQLAESGEHQPLDQNLQPASATSITVDKSLESEETDYVLPEIAVNIQTQRHSELNLNIHENSKESRSHVFHMQNAGSTGSTGPSLNINSVDFSQQPAQYIFQGTTSHPQDTTTNILNTAVSQTLSDTVLQSSSTPVSQFNQVSQSDITRLQPTQREGVSVVPTAAISQEKETTGQSATATNKFALNNLLHKGDTLSWTQSQTKDAHVYLRNTLSQLSVVSATDELVSVPRISTENIISNLTQLLPQPIQNALRGEQLALRQEFSPQYIQVGGNTTETVADQFSGTQQQFDLEGESLQPGALSSSVKKADATADASFSQSLSQSTSEKTALSTVDIMKPGLSGFSAQISEDNIISQVIQKFRLSQTLQNSKLVMKLHPVELGELKIDIQLKNGTINATILAQSQQVQDILEKNMPRLREMMEQQGFTVDEMAINLDTDVAAEYNMFEEHLAKDEDSFSNGKNKKSHSAFSLANEQDETIEASGEDDKSSVNLKA